MLGREHRLDALLLALLVVLPVIFYWRVLTPNPSDRGSFPNGDFGEQFFAFARFASDQLSQGRLPLWNPYTYAGHPFIADVQSAVFYPPSLLVMVASWWLGGFSLYALEWQAALHFALAGVFTYLFARAQLHEADVDSRERYPTAGGCREVATRTKLCALVPALVFTFGGYLTSYPSQQLAVLETDVWLPLILLYLWKSGGAQPGGPSERGTASRRRWVTSLPALALAGLFFGIALLAGHPQSAFYVLLVCIALGVFYGRFERGRRWRAVAPALAIFVVVALGVAAVQWIPSLEFMQLSSRSSLGYADYARGFELQDPLQLLLPGSVSLYSPLYIGIAPLALVVCALWLPPRVTRRAWFWLALALAALALSFGGNLFLYPLLYLFVPGFQLFRQQERAAFIFSFALAMLSGYGALALAQALPRAAHRRLRALARLTLCAAAGAAILFVLVYFAWMQFELAPDSPFRAAGSQAAWLALMLGLLAGLFWLRVHGRLRPAVLLAALAVLTALDLFTVNWHTNFQSAPPEAQTSPPDFLKPILADTVAAGSRWFRTYNEYRIPGNFGDLFGIEDTGGASPLRLARYEDLTQLPMQRLWALLNVKYVITWRRSLSDLGVQSEVVAQQKVSDTETTYVHRLSSVSPRAAVVTQVQQVQDERELLDRLASPDFDFGARALSIAPLTLGASDGAAGRATPVAHLPGFYVWEAHAPADALFVLSENAYPGWRAFVSGREVPVVSVNGTMMGARVPAGDSAVTFVFDPLSVKLGAAISLLTLAALLAGSIAGRWIT